VALLFGYRHAAIRQAFEFVLCHSLICGQFVWRYGLAERVEFIVTQGRYPCCLSGACVLFETR
jgi:hypothetical protein